MSPRLGSNYARDLGSDFAMPWRGDTAPDPSVLRWNDALASDLGLKPDEWTPEMLTGGAAPEGATPVAQVYAGHQFGGFSQRLGDGRAVLLGEIVDAAGDMHDITLKGSGPTPFSRGGDGKAVLGPVLREYLIAEAMHALGVPTTRALAMSLTGEQVLRDTGLKPGAVLARTASSHLRVGTFQYFAARRETGNLRMLTNYALKRHYPELTESDQPALDLLRAVCAVQAKLIAEWMGLGFVHGVMNTDNMTISGETIDYGPCAFLDTYDPATVFSSIDHQGRYAYGNQPAIAQWNLARLAEALLPLIDADTDRAIALAVPVIEDFMALYETARLHVFAKKLGLAVPQATDLSLINAVLDDMKGQDFTNSFTRLAHDASGSEVLATRRATEPAAPRTPVVIPRNHLVEEALSAAETGDTAPFDALLDAVTRPYDEDLKGSRFAAPPADLVPYQTYCGT